jgi:hypothetical protein
MSLRQNIHLLAIAYLRAAQVSGLNRGLEVVLGEAPCRKLAAVNLVGLVFSKAW